MKRSLVCIVLSLIILFRIAPIASSVSISGISAKAYVLIEADTGIIIASGNEHTALPMASTTKIMTTLLLIESGNLDEQFKVDNNAIKVEGSSMGLCDDDIVTKRALCYGMMLPSGNDAANQTAVLLAGNTEDFSVMMNKRASEIGLTNTNFVTPSGLHHDNHYSTAYDMALLAGEALKNELFREICSSKKAQLEFGNPPYERWLINTNKLLTKYEHCIGVKTGFTDEAGRCLVSAAEKDGTTLICVTLNAPDDWNDHMKLYDYGFSVAQKQNIDFDFSELYVDVAGGNCDMISVVPAKMPSYTQINGKNIDLVPEIIIQKFVYAPVEKNQTIGKLNFYYNNRLVFSTELITTASCDAVIKERKTTITEKITDFIKGLL